MSYGGSYIGRMDDVSYKRELDSLARQYGQEALRASWAEARSSAYRWLPVTPYEVTAEDREGALITLRALLKVNNPKKEVRDED